MFLFLKVRNFYIVLKDVQYIGLVQNWHDSSEGQKFPPIPKMTNCYRPIKRTTFTSSIRSLYTCKQIEGSEADPSTL